MTPQRHHPVVPDLSGVPETMLWTLFQRASEAARPDPVLEDPWAMELCRRLDYPFVARFGPAYGLLAQSIALRAAAFDGVVRAFLREFPYGTVVALGEGLETAFWRVDNGRVQWLTVDLPEPLRVRETLLPAEGRRRVLACDARDPRWTGAVPPARPTLVTAQGLLMYLRPQEVRDLIALCACSFPGGGLVFDAVPRWFAAGTRRGRLRTPSGYPAPEMPWGMNADQRARLREADPRVAEVHAIPLPPGRGLVWGTLAPRLAARGPLSNRRPTVTLLRFTSR
ncbi:class I SAM-dependent methyltransferase [Streptacidiphilus rugosus]|uniref:class I SAM-dependent methyltransferase n=1 Tax=Streptacidiphilus rugosus TaxID=405783 RepID=UPI000569B455|nr:class I SAM-dependent methyltransferase [Streptacidiphilus rugosus]